VATGRRWVKGSNTNRVDGELWKARNDAAPRAWIGVHLRCERRRARSMSSSVLHSPLHVRTGAVTPAVHCYGGTDSDYFLRFCSYRSHDACAPFTAVVHRHFTVSTLRHEQSWAVHHADAAKPSDRTRATQCAPTHVWAVRRSSERARGAACGMQRPATHAHAAVAQHAMERGGRMGFGGGPRPAGRGGAAHIGSHTGAGGAGGGGGDQ
jgi:hypothetical protein